ncbi:glycosyltransferase family 2 protein [Nocardioides sp.]|uniref:glycosyltransferase family 2 protein n=1 Tax=Nocardioides sp. TaxID=35761 RepID=UPI0025CF4B4A|nr:glycosyltransferase family 2 protein [Nocardioides sp.]
MKLGRRLPVVSVVVPVYDVEAYLPAALDSVLAQTHQALEVVIVDDGSTDGSGAIADQYAARDPRVRVVHTANHGLGAARNEGARHATGELLAFADSDDVVPPRAYEVMRRQQRRTGADFVTGSVARWDGGRLEELPWMRRLHTPRAAYYIEQHPEILGDVFAWNKLFRREFWDGAGLAWPEGIRYEDQPATTRAYITARRFAVVPDVVYHWRIRHDGSSITQQRSSMTDLQDRWTTKRMSLSTVRGFGSDKVTRTFVDKVLAGDMHRYFVEIPGCPDEWWDLLVAGVREFWGERTLAASGLPPVHRLTGWLVGQGRREEAELVMRFVAAHVGPVPQVPSAQGPRIDVPGIDPASVDPAALALRDFEVRI